jgi:REP element-mobilizing transposase RayT
MLRHTPGLAVWQRNYYEHVIRDEAEWGSIREYIEMNPAHWATDSENQNGDKKGQ